MEALFREGILYKFTECEGINASERTIQWPTHSSIVSMVTTTHHILTTPKSTLEIVPFSLNQQNPGDTIGMN